MFCTDEHRLGLKPVLRSVWAPRGQRPIALGHHRFQWLYVTAFVGPATGETVWYLTDTVSKPLFAGLLDAFAREVGAGPEKRVVLLLDNAGWHTRPNLVVPEGLRLVYLPPYSPELQPAETLWTLVDEPIVNTFVPNLDKLIDTITGIGKHTAETGSGCNDTVDLFDGDLRLCQSGLSILRNARSFHPLGIVCPGLWQEEP